MKYALQDLLRSFEIVIVDLDHSKISKCLEVPFHQYCESIESHIAKFLEELGREMYLGFIQRLSKPSFGIVRHDLGDDCKFTDFFPQYTRMNFPEGILFGIVSRISGRSLALVLDFSGSHPQISCSEILLEDEFDILEPETLEERRVQMTDAVFFSLCFDSNWIQE